MCFKLLIMRLVIMRDLHSTDVYSYWQYECTVFFSDFAVELD